MHVAFGILFHVFHQRVCISSSVSEVFEKSFIVEERAHTVVLGVEFMLQIAHQRSELSSHLTHICYRSIHIVHSAIEVRFRQIITKSGGISGSAIEMSHHHRNILCHKSIKSSRGLFELRSDNGCIAESLLKFGRSRQAVDIGENAIYFRHHLLHLRHHRTCLFHGTLVHSASEGVEWGQHGSRILTKKKIHCHSSHHCNF